MKLALIIVALVVSSIGNPAFAQSFPNKPIELVVTSNPGGGVDLLFRLLAEELTKVVKAQINVVNQTAGSGAIGAEKIASARKDGYSLPCTVLRPIGTMKVGQPHGT